jgi:hypothetical protein
MMSNMIEDALRDLSGEPSLARPTAQTQGYVQT